MVICQLSGDFARHLEIILPCLELIPRVFRGFLKISRKFQLLFTSDQVSSACVGIEFQLILDYVCNETVTLFMMNFGCSSYFTRNLPQGCKCLQATYRGGGIIILDIDCFCLEKNMHTYMRSFCLSLLNSWNCICRHLLMFWLFSA